MTNPSSCRQPAALLPRGVCTAAVPPPAAGLAPPTASCQVTLAPACALTPPTPPTTHRPGPAFLRHLAGTCTWTCDNAPSIADCLTCSVDDTIELTDDPAHDYRIKLNLNGCKGGAVSWVCCRDGCDVAPDTSLCTSLEVTAAGRKCEDTSVVWVDVNEAQPQITIQVHDGKQAGTGNNAETGNCPGPTCCGGGGGSCGTPTHVCNYQLDISDCLPVRVGNPPVGCTVTQVGLRHRVGGGQGEACCAA